MQRNQKDQTLKKLARKVLQGEATEAEKQFIDEYYNLFNKSKVADELSSRELNSIGLEIESRLNESTTSRPHRSFQFFTPLRVAASLAFLLLLGYTGYMLIYDKTPKRLARRNIEKPSEVIVAGTNKAILTLADGSRVMLDDMESGTLATQEGVSVAKRGSSSLDYEIKSTQKVVSSQVNILETPRGGIFQVTLSDGTHVWLNSASRIKYPVNFSATERRVELEGEAYFEVAHREKQPFRVVSKNQTIEVLGTHFNVSTYPEQTQTHTTLLQGSVKVMPVGSQSQAILKPGQESATDGKQVQVRSVDTDYAVAWKQGIFRFDHDDIQTIMNKISRWYDVDVVYLNDVKDVRFGGSVSRFTDIEKVLNKLELTNTIHFRIEGRQIFVRK